MSGAVRSFEAALNPRLKGLEYLTVPAPSPFPAPPKRVWTKAATLSCLPPRKTAPSA